MDPYQARLPRTAVGSGLYMYVHCVDPLHVWVGLEMSHDSLRAWRSAKMAQALFRACREKDLECIKAALSREPSLLNHRGENGRTLLHEACRYVLFLILIHEVMWDCFDAIIWRGNFRHRYSKAWLI